MDSAYIETVRLLLTVAPEVFRGRVFAMKGGTALNLFVHEMPRLSVDIDLVFLDHATPRSEAERLIAEELTRISENLRHLGISARTISSKNESERKLLVQRPGVQVKVEANLVFRGTVLPIAHRSLAQEARELFSAELSLPVLAVDELYGSKLVAALDRQHPRDLFDVYLMYQTYGLTDSTVACFVLYLAGHNRPLHEVLFPHRKDISLEFQSSFTGMTRHPIELATLLAARDRLLDELPRRLTPDQRQFLIGLARARPDWSLAGCAHAADLPAIRWRLQNLERFRESKPEAFETQSLHLEEDLRIRAP